MQTLQQTYNPAYLSVSHKRSLLSQITAWFKSQEQYRFVWLAVIIAAHGCALTPATVLLVTLGGNNLIFWIMAIAAMAMALVTNLAAMPTRITIPVFFLSVLIDLVIMGINLYHILSV